jgi:RNA polymerase sigma-54 factor
MELSLGQRMGMEQRIAPKMLAFYNLLAMNAAELEQTIADELVANPALELAADAECPRCGARLRGATCPECGLDAGASAATSASSDGTLEWIELPSADAQRLSDDLADPLAAIPAPSTLRDHLRWLLRASTRAEDWPAAEALLERLDDDGYLREPLSQIAAAAGLAEESLERALRALQSLEPPGVGARDLQECLLIQIQQLAAAGDEHGLVREILWEHWDLFSRHRFDALASAMGRSLPEIQEAADFIRDQLSPYPGREWRPEGQDQWPTAVAPPVRPDIVYVPVGESEAVRFEARLVESPRLLLRLSSSYAELARELRGRPDALPASDRKHIAEHVHRAREFMENITRRRTTLKRVADRIAEHQAPFLAHGPRQLRPLTRLRVARELRIHESTVGRAMAGKYALVPDGAVVAFEAFFDASFPAREAVRRLVADEDPHDPLTDDELAARLAAEGFQVARRTVAKYRQQLKIPPASQRRRFA